MFNKPSKQKKRPIDKFLFDDCPICQEMKKADRQGRNLTMSELKAAFQKARDQGAAVGGEWLDGE